MSAIGIDDIEGLLGVSQYEEQGEFPVEQGYIWTTCSSVENGNPLFWDPEVAKEVTGGPIAPPTMVSATIFCCCSGVRNFVTGALFQVARRMRGIMVVSP